MSDIVKKGSEVEVASSFANALDKDNAAIVPVDEAAKLNRCTFYLVEDPLDETVNFKNCRCKYENGHARAHETVDGRRWNSDKPLIFGWRSVDAANPLQLRGDNVVIDAETARRAGEKNANTLAGLGGQITMQPGLGGTGERESGPLESLLSAEKWDTAAPALMINVPVSFVDSMTFATTIFGTAVDAPVTPFVRCSDEREYTNIYGDRYIYNCTRESGHDGKHVSDAGEEW